MNNFKNFKNEQKPELAKHDASILDLAFVMDCTGSMSSYIKNATDSIRQIVEEIVSLEKSDINLALVEYRDHPPQETTFVTRKHDFTPSVKEMKKWLESCSAVGGGDAPEAVADGLQDALNLTWRLKATKICVLISDAPPHGLGCSGDSMPNGCPLGIDPLAVVDKMAEKGITLYSIGCEPALVPYKQFFSALAYKTGGQYVPLRNANLLAKVIVGGALEELNLEKLMDDARSEMEEQHRLGNFDSSEISKAVHKKLAKKGAYLPTLFYNDSNIEKASSEALCYAKQTNLADFRKEKSTFGSKISTEPMYGASITHASTSKNNSLFAKSMKFLGFDKYGDKNMVIETEDTHDLAIMPSISSRMESDSYKVMSSEINEDQADRIVQKLLKRK